VKALTSSLGSLPGAGQQVPPTASKLYTFKTTNSVHLVFELLKLVMQWLPHNSPAQPGLPSRTAEAAGPGGGVEPGRHAALRPAWAHPGPSLAPVTVFLPPGERGGRDNRRAAGEAGRVLRDNGRGT